MINRQEEARSPGALPASAGEVLERFRQPIEGALRKALEGRDGPMYSMLLYHLGLDGASPPQGKALRPTLCLLIDEALGGS